MFGPLIRKSVITAFFVFALFLNLGIGSSFVEATDNYQVSDSLKFLADRQNLNDGGLIEISEDQSNDLQTAWGVIAFSAAGFDPGTVKNTTGSVSLLKNLTDKACSFSSTTDIERTILALSSANYQLSEILGCDLIAELESKIDPVSGQIGNDIPSTVFGVLALSAEDRILPAETIDYLKDRQQSGGGWDSGWGVESNITAQTVMALLVAGVDKTDPMIINAKNYLKSLQTATGGIKYDNNSWTAYADAFSDSFVLQMIYALKESPDDNFWRAGEKTIVDDLMSLKNDDNSFNFSQTWGALTPVWTTEIVTIALSEKYLPVEGTDLKNY
ncbi:MAG: prenyltransferase/squalene oxidase repeat-containing protein, partial [Candidatus Paceibacterota bacterium]